MDEEIKAMLEVVKENHNSAAEIISGIISQSLMHTTTDNLLATLIQVEVTNGCVLAEILSLLNAQKEGGHSLRVSTFLSTP